MECGDAMDNTFLWEADPRKSYGESLLVYQFLGRLSSHKDHCIIELTQGANPGTVCSHARLCRRLVSPNSFPPARDTHRDIRTHYRKDFSAATMVRDVAASAAG